MKPTIIRAIFKTTVPFVAYFFMLLFVYAGASKMGDFENFQVQLAQSPLLSAYAGFISYGVIVLELVIALMLSFPKTRRVGLYASFGLMVAFTVYIYLILNYSDFVPCSCGGILEKMGWTEHLIFNIGSVVMAGLAIIADRPTIRKTPVMYVTEEYWIEKFLQKKRDHRMLIFNMCMLLILPSGLMVALFLSSEHIIKKENNFTRRFLLHPVIGKKTLKLNSRTTYFAGVDSQHIYLGDRALPQMMTTIDPTLSKISQMKILPDTIFPDFLNVRVQVKSPYYYFYDGTIPVIFRGKINNPRARIISYGDAYFSQLIILDSLRFALRVQNKVNKEFMIAGLNMVDSPRVRLYTHILEKQSDGVFDVDGRFIPIQNENAMVYTYLYRNEFIVVNDNYNIHQRFKTIDTTNVANIKITKLSDGKFKMNAPPMKVNLNTAANRMLLFNQSDLMGRFESRKARKKAVTIDIYRTDVPEYVGSFYISKKDGNGVRDILATDKYLYVLMGDEIIRLTFTSTITKNFNRGS